MCITMTFNQIFRIIQSMKNQKPIYSKLLLYLVHHSEIFCLELCILSFVKETLLHRNEEMPIIVVIAHMYYWQYSVTHYSHHIDGYFCCH